MLHDKVKHRRCSFTCKLPELDVFDSHSDQFVRDHGITLHHEDLVLVTPERRRTVSNRQLQLCVR